MTISLPERPDIPSSTEDTSNAPSSPSPAASTNARHIALIITALGPGGAERVMTAMANHWVAFGHRVSFITYEAEGATSFYDLDPRIQVQRLGLETGRRMTRLGMILTARRVLALRRRLKALNPDIAIAFLTRVNIVTLLATIGQNLPVIISERNHPDRQYLNRVWRWLRDRTYRRAAALVCQTEGARRCYPPELRAQAVVIANPLRSIQAAVSPAGKNELVAVGRLTEQKGFDLLLRAFARIAARFPAWTLTIWGEGEKRPALESLCDELGLAGRARLPGVTEDHGAWVADAGLFVLSSRYEGMPNVLLEAMAAGLPVVAFDCPLGPGEMITPGENGILVPPEDVDALADSLAGLMADQDERARLAENARAVVDTYRIDAIMAKWSGLIEGHGTR